MAIALIGASGKLGTQILKALSDRGHQVTAIARNPEKIAKLPHVTPKQGDIRDTLAMTALLKGHGIVISSVRLTDSDPHLLLNSIKAAGVRRYLVVGGTGSLDIASGLALSNSPALSDSCKAEAVKGNECLTLLRQDSELNWTFLSPSAQLLPGLRPRRFHSSAGSHMDYKPRKRVSLEEVALALVNEIEKPAHHREHFTVGY